MAAMLAGALMLSLTVRVYNAYGVPRASLGKAQKAVERILHDADVAVAWTMCPCDTPVSADELVLRIVAAAPSTPPGSLGFSYVDVARRKGTLATVFADRIDTLAAAVDVDGGELLGRAAAHEISHLLLGTNDHETRGLMRGVWPPGELSTRTSGEWALLPDDRVRIRQAIARRLLESTPPVAVTADSADRPNVSAQ
jgi:hypothetical protein